MIEPSTTYYPCAGHGQLDIAGSRTVVATYDLHVTQKLRYEIDLSRFGRADAADHLGARPISRDDVDDLAELMLDAYVGTIDYEGETLDDAIEEVRGFLDSESSLPGRSFVVEDEARIVSGVLVSMVEGVPFIGYVMTIPSHKNQGLARLVVGIALDRLAYDGHESAALYITDGNVASEALFRSVGAVQVDE